MRVSRFFVGAPGRPETLFRLVFFMRHPSFGGGQGREKLDRRRYSFLCGGVAHDRSDGPRGPRTHAHRWWWPRLIGASRPAGGLGGCACKGSLVGHECNSITPLRSSSTPQRRTSVGRGRAWWPPEPSSPRFNLFRLPPAQRGWILTSTSASELSPWPLNAHSR